MQNIFLTPHFTLQEFCASQTAEKHGIVNVPSELEVENLRRLCEGCLEPLREAIGLPIIITSGFRTKALNDKLAHTSSTSQHMRGEAADFYVGEAQVSGSKIQDCPSGESAHARDNSSKLGSPLAQSQTSGDLKLETGASPMKLGTPRQRLVKAFREILQNPKIDYDQLILYPTFIHVSYVSKEKNRRGILLARSDGTLGYGRITLANALKIS